jgi:hypothetical protein
MEFGIVPNTDLDLMRSEQSLTDLTCRALKSIDEYLIAQKPDLVLVQGDTTTVSPRLSQASTRISRSDTLKLACGLAIYDLRGPKRGIGTDCRGAGKVAAELVQPQRPNT